MDTAASDTAFLWPDRLNAGLLADGHFARAYEAVGPANRGRLKALIAALLALHPPRRVDERRADAAHLGGLRATTLERPRPFVAALLDAGFSSPAKLLAALLPALSAGVGQVAVVRLGTGRMPSGMLAALELAGIEAVARLSSADCAALLAELAARDPAGALLCFGPKALRLAEATPLPRWDCMPGWEPARIGLLDVHHEDVEAALEFLHPGYRRERPASWDGAEAVAPDAIVCPDAMLPRALGRAPLAWGPAQAGFWLWPELTPEFFLERRFALGGRP